MLHHDFSPVRCWHSPGEGQARYVVEVVSEASQHWGFRTLDELLAFLRTELGDKPHEPGKEADTAGP